MLLFKMTWSSTFSKIAGGAVPRELIMPPWSEDELVKAAPFVRPDLTQVQIEERYCVVGGSARHIFTEGNATSVFLRTSATTCTPTALLALVKDEKLSLAAYSQAGRGVGALVHIQVTAPYTVEEARYEFASLEAADAVFQKLSALCKNELDTMLHKFLQNKLSGGLCGPMVECKMHSQLVSKGATVHVTDLHNGAKMLVKIPAANDGHACRYRNLSAVDPAKRFYYQPAKANEGAIDVIMPPRVCLQSTISHSHPILMGCMKQVAQHLLVR